MRTATVLSALVAAGLTVGAATAEAQTSASIQATATVLSALTVAAGNNLVFGNVTPGVNKTIAITDGGAGHLHGDQGRDQRCDPVVHAAHQPRFRRRPAADR